MNMSWSFDVGAPKSPDVLPPTYTSPPATLTATASSEASVPNWRTHLRTPDLLIRAMNGLDPPGGVGWPAKVPFVVPTTYASPDGVTAMSATRSFDVVPNTTSHFWLPCLSKRATQASALLG